MLELSILGDKNKDPIVLIHGWSVLLDGSTEFLSELSKQHTLLLPRLPGYGQSPENTQAQSLEFLADQVWQTCQAAGYRNFHVLGFSMGAQVALCMAERHALSIKKLVLVGARPANKRHRTLAVLLKIPGLVNFIRHWPRLEYWVVNRGFAFAQSLTPGKSRRNFEPGKVSLHGAFDTLVAQITHYHNPLKSSPNTLFLYGSNDQMRPSKWTADFPIIIVDNAGHNCLKPGGAKLAQKVDQFLQN